MTGRIGFFKKTFGFAYVDSPGYPSQSFFFHHSKVTSGVPGSGKSCEFLLGERDGPDGRPEVETLDVLDTYNF